MIVSFRHKGLKRLYERDDASGVNPQWRGRVRAILARLDAAHVPEDMDLPGLRLHRLVGDRRDRWAVTVSGNWRIVFCLDQDGAREVDLVDYH